MFTGHMKKLKQRSDWFVILFILNRCGKLINVDIVEKSVLQTCVPFVNVLRNPKEL